MKSLTANKKLITILAISLAVSLAIPYALANSGYSAAPTPSIPSQCTTAIATGWTAIPIINARMTVYNSEDSGLVGYWALDNFMESFVIWQNTGTTPNTFCALQQYSGYWTTYRSALSPQNGVSELHAATGSMVASIVKIFTGTFLGPYCQPTISVHYTKTTTTEATTTITTHTRVTSTSTCPGTYSTEPLTGNIGTFNLGGSRSQILLGTYAKQTAFNPTSFLTFYFKTPTITSEPAWSWIYTQGNGVGYGNMWVNDLSGSFGDIVT